MQVLFVLRQSIMIDRVARG